MDEDILLPLGLRVISMTLPLHDHSKSSEHIVRVSTNMVLQAKVVFGPNGYAIFGFIGRFHRKSVGLHMHGVCSYPRDWASGVNDVGYLIYIIFWPSDVFRLRKGFRTNYSWVAAVHCCERCERSH